jgi:hypothetical protein
MANIPTLVNGTINGLDVAGSKSVGINISLRGLGHWGQKIKPVMVVSPWQDKCG